MDATNTTAVENFRSSYQRKDNESSLVQFIETKPIEEITEVVSVVGHKCVSHPKGVGSKFTSLKSFTLSEGLLWRITKTDLEQLGSNVIKIDYSNNRIDFLETDLFINNPKLEDIDFGWNRITAISSKLGMENLKALIYLRLNVNTCISRMYYCMPTWGDCSGDVERFKQEVAESCNDDQSVVNEKIQDQFVQLKSDFQSSLAETSRKFDAQIVQVGKDIQTVKTDMTKDMQELNKNLIATMDKQALEIKQNITNIQNTLERIHRIIEIALEDKNAKSEIEKNLEAI